MISLLRRMRSKCGLCALAVLALAAGISACGWESGGIRGTLAYYTGRFESVGELRQGCCDIEIREVKGAGFGTVEVGEDFVLHDVVTVRNTGSYPCYVRAAVDYDSYLSEEASQIVGMSDKWICSDGYYYYTEVLEPGDESEALITGINVSALSEEAAEGFGVGVYAEAMDALSDAEWEDDVA